MTRPDTNKGEIGSTIPDNCPSKMLYGLIFSFRSGENFNTFREVLQSIPTAMAKADARYPFSSPAAASPNLRLLQSLRNVV
jgi:hypothetical protein